MTELNASTLSQLPPKVAAQPYDRSRLIALFDLFDPADPEVIAGRRKLANALH